MKLKVISSEHELFDGEVLSATFPGTSGRFTVLENHAPLISTLETGEIEYTEPGGKQSRFSVEGGYVEIHDNRVTVCIR